MRRWIFIPLLAAAVAAPPLLMNDETTEDQNGIATKAESTSFSLFGLGGGDDQQIQTAEGALHPDEINLLKPGSMAYAPGARDFREVFRFDANPQWLQQNWPRVSVVTSRDEYLGYRVPLVTGPGTDDLTGALTYYFDRDNVCQRISFNGFVGNPHRLLQLAGVTFKMKPEARLGQGIYTTEAAKQVRSLLAVESPKVIYADKSKQSLKVTLELNNPRGTFRLSPEVQEMVRQAALFHAQ